MVSLSAYLLKIGSKKLYLVLIRQFAAETPVNNALRSGSFFVITMCYRLSISVLVNLFFGSVFAKVSIS